MHQSNGQNKVPEENLLLYVGISPVAIPSRTYAQRAPLISQLVVGIHLTHQYLLRRSDYNTTGSTVL